jgi:hypothetical protein
MESNVKSQALDLKNRLNEALDELHKARFNRNAREEERSILRIQLLACSVTHFLDKLSKIDN